MESRQPETIDRIPSLAQRCARTLLKWAGWRAVLVPPPAPKGIIIVYPHTSNWDFIIGVLYRTGTGLPVRWLGKHTLFRWPAGRLLHRIGGIPIRRGQHSGFVTSVLAEYARQDWMWLVLAPEGTRSRTNHWKSGFYQIAVAAGLPVGLGFIDYATRTVGIETYMNLTENVDQDLDRIRAFYAGKRGRRPENAGTIALRP